MSGITRAYRVKQGNQLQDEGIIYSSGMVVYLTAEKATFHGTSIEPVFDIPDEPDPPFEAAIIAYRNQDLEYNWVIEQYTVDISAITSGSTSTITTSTAHYLQSGAKVNIRIVSDTIGYDVQTVATVTTATQFTVPILINLPQYRDVAEVGIPADQSLYIFSGGLYDYVTAEENLVFSGEFGAVSGSKRVTLTGKSREELEWLSEKDLLTIGSAGLTNAVVVARSEIVSVKTTQWQRAYFLSVAATATVDTNEAFAKRTIYTTETGDPISGKSFTFGSTNLDYGLIKAKLDRLQYEGLEPSVMPFRIIATRNGTEDTVLIIGTFEVN